MTDYLLMLKCLRDAWYLSAYGDGQAGEDAAPFMTPESVATVAVGLYQTRSQNGEYEPASGDPTQDHIDSLQNALVEKESEMNVGIEVNIQLTAQILELQGDIRSLRAGIANKIKHDKGKP